jgi:hypothetical protein
MSRYPFAKGRFTVRKNRLRSWAIAGWLAVSAGACSSDFDTSREPRPYAQKATLGQDIFGVLCDRIGAGALAEDVTASSYHAICHPDASGRYADKVDTSKLPVAEGAAAIARSLAVAKLEAMARRRADLCTAFDTILPDVEIDDPHPPKDAGGKAQPRKVRLHDALRSLTQRLIPLYDTNPLASAGASPNPLLPSGTQALARLFEALATSTPAQAAFAKLGGREGYKPLTVALGAVKPILAYPDLRTLAQKSVVVLGPGGSLRAPFKQLLEVVHEELASSETTLALAPYVVDDPDGIAQPNRPRDNLEVLHAVLLSSDPVFADVAATPAPIVMRDPRGFALAAGSKLGVPGSVSTPFVDLAHDGPNGAEPGPDGLADVDSLGRFVDGNGKPVEVDLPFDVPGTTRVRKPDAQGRALLGNGQTAYQYLETTETLVAALARDLRPLADPDPVNDHETLIDALAGAYVLFGDRTAPSGATAVYPGGKKLHYTGFDASGSPIVELVHALGQMLADPESDDFLRSLIDLAESHEQEVARLIGAALGLREIADKYPNVSLPASSTMWDEMGELLTRIAAVGPANGDPNGRTLLEDLLLAFGDPRSLQLGPCYSKYMQFKDRVSYDPDDINGPVKNLNSNDHQPPHVKVDRSKPAMRDDKTGDDNRSNFQRSLQLIVDSSAKTCNKAGGAVHLDTEILGFGMAQTYPTEPLLNLVPWSVVCTAVGASVQNPLEECGVVEIENGAILYLQSMIEDDPSLPAEANKHKARLIVKDQCLTKLSAALKLDMDATFEKSSTLTGMTTHPTHFALSRLLFFRSDSTGYKMPDLDPTRLGKNKKLNGFVSDLQDPMGTSVCPKNAKGVDTCSKVEDLLRLRDRETIFLWEHFGFADAMRPTLRAFYDHDREDLFIEFVAWTHRHMAAANEHGPECEKKGTWIKDDPKVAYNPRYCSEDGLVKYEELLAEQFLTDIIPAVARVVNILKDQRIKSVRYRAAKGEPNLERRGSEIAAQLTRALFDSNRASKLNLADRNGQRSTLWCDGTTVKKQLTPYDLFANAIKKIDERFDTAKDFAAEDRNARRARWRKARSQLVDQFLAVDGAGEQATMRNPATHKTLITVLKVLREQLNARCPDREKTGHCDWARTEIADKVAETFQGPLFAAMFDLLDALGSDPSHFEVERLLQYLLEMVKTGEVLRTMLSSSSDLVQVLRDGQTLPPIFNVLASLSVPDGTLGPDGKTPATGATDVTLQLLNVLTHEPDEATDPTHATEFDRYHVVDKILPNLVKPIDTKRPSKTALETIMDAAAEVNRYDSSDRGAYHPEDYREIARSARDFLTSPTRGMEQLYTVVRGRNGD